MLMAPPTPPASDTTPPPPETAAALPLLGFAMLRYNAKGAPFGIFDYITLGLAVLGASFTASTYPNRRIRFTRFDAKSGRGGLDVGFAGNSAAAFKEFVEKIARQIKKAR